MHNNTKPNVRSIILILKELELIICTTNLNKTDRIKIVLEMLKLQHKISHN